VLSERWLRWGKSRKEPSPFLQSTLGAGGGMRSASALGRGAQRVLGAPPAPTPSLGDGHAHAGMGAKGELGETGVRCWELPDWQGLLIWVPLKGAFCSDPLEINCS